MAKLHIAKDLFDLLYPVGSYYETSNTSWTPTSAGWYGTWVEDTQGRITLASGRPTQNNDTSFGALTNDQITSWWFNVGTTYGEYQHQLTTNEMPSHTHTISSSGGHNHNARFKEQKAPSSGDSWDFARSATQSYDAIKQVTITDGSHTHTPANTGGGAVHNQIPPVVVVKRWHRTA